MRPVFLGALLFLHGICFAQIEQYPWEGFGISDSYSTTSDSSLSIPRGDGGHPPSQGLPVSTPPLPGVVTVSFSPQGAESLKTMTGKRVPGIQIVQAIACTSSSGGATISGGLIYQAAQALSIQTISPKAAGPVLMRSSKRNFWSYAIDIVGLATIGFPTLISSGAISASTKWVTGLLAAHGVIDQGVRNIQARLPDPTPVTSNLWDDSAATTLGPSSCSSGFILVVYDKKNKPVISSITL